MLEPIYDRFIERLVEAARSLVVGPTENPRSSVGPVVDEEAQDRILRVIDQGEREAKLVFRGDAPANGYFVAPTIFSDVKPESSLAQKEILRPFLSVIKAKDLAHALEIANSVEFALTGGFYSRSPADIEKVKAEFECGNLYINRGCTGALVERHPFRDSNFLAPEAKRVARIFDSIHGTEGHHGKYNAPRLRRRSKNQSSPMTWQDGQYFTDVSALANARYLIQPDYWAR